MSLIDEYMENFIIVDKTTVPDGYGGVETRYVDGATIQAALSFNGSTEMKIAQSIGVTTAYTVTVKKEINLDFYTILRRESNGQIFRILSNGDDNKTPASATLNMRQYSAEVWNIPTEGVI